MRRNVAKYLPSLLLGLLLAASACERPAPPPAESERGAYNLAAYLQQQAQRLQQEQPMVLKSVKTEEKPTETIETPNVDWEDELSMFEDLDLNKPTLQDYYTRTDSTLPNGATSIRYTKLPDAETPVLHLQMLLSPQQHLQELKALVQDKNVLFFTRRELRLSADPQSGNLSSYGVKGTQKLIFGDTLHYSVDANL